MKNSIFSAAILSLSIVGCGGSGSGSGSKTPGSAVSVTSSMAAVSSLAASSAANSVASSIQASSTSAVLTGVFLDAAVKNIGFRTATQQGFTNERGEFTYRAGERVTFFIGNLELPAVLAGGIITPLEIANTQNLSDNQLVNILRLLQSLDADGNTENGIDITAAAITAGAVLDFTLPPEVFAALPAVKDLLQASGSTKQELVTTEQAVAHFQTTLASINGASSSSSSQSSVVIVESSSSANSSDAVVQSSSSSISSEAIAQTSSASNSSEAIAISSSSVSSADAQVSSSIAMSEAAVSSSEAASQSSQANSSVAPVAEIIFAEEFAGATASNFYTTYRVNSKGQSLYKKSGGTPVFADGTIGLTGARFTIGETGKDLDLSRPYRLSFDVVQASGSSKVQIFVDNASTSGDKIFDRAANTLITGQRFVLESTVGTATSFIQIRAESSATLVLDNLTIEYTGTAGVSSSAASNANSSAGTNSSAGNTSSVSSSANVSSIASSSSSSAPYIPPSVNLSADCIRLATDSSVNWRDTALQTDQEIVECLSQSLGKPVGYGENAKGGYDPNGNSKLTIITKNSSVSVEQQLLDAITGEAHNWIVFDKVEFAQPHEIGMYRLGCSNATVQSILGATEAECVNYQQWCAKNNVSESACVSTFFNTAMNKSNNPIRNPVIGSNKTIDGRMSEAYFIFSGFAIGKDSTGTPTQTANSVIMTHLRFKGAGHTEDHYCDPDMIRSTGASHDIWIHKNTFDTTGDSAFDVKVGAHNVTMSFNRLVNVKRAVLHGSSDSHTIDTQITTTMHHNAFVTTDDSYMLLGNTLRRVPLLRHGKTHMFNNVFVNYRKEILSLRVGASAQMEDSVFVVNAALQEKSSVAASLAEISTNYFKDISDGYFRNDRNFLWFGSGSCDLDNNTKTALTATNGAVTDLSANYNAASLNMINGWRFEAGQELVDYLSATAGKYGQVPFNSPLSGDRYYIAGLGKVPCQ